MGGDTRRHFPLLIAVVAVTALVVGGLYQGTVRAAAGKLVGTTAPAPSAASVPFATSSKSSLVPAPNWREGPTVLGVDLSREDAHVDWAALAASDRFVYLKATQGNAHVNAIFADQRTAARAAGLLQGAYHEARPAQSSGVLQARFFAANGGTWTPDGKTLPGALALTFSSDSDGCYGLTAEQLRTWVEEFSAEYARLSGRLPALSVSTGFWSACLDSPTTFGANPLWLIAHDADLGPLPAGWEHATLWQTGEDDGIHQNRFFGTEGELRVWASAP